MPDDVWRVDINAELGIAADGFDSEAVAQCLSVRCEVVLGFDEKLAVLIVGVGEHSIDVPRSGNVSDAIGDAQQRGLDIFLLVEMGDADHRDVKLFGHFFQRREDTAHVSC